MAKTSVIEMRKRIEDAAYWLLGKQSWVALSHICDEVETRGRLGVSQGFAESVLKDAGYTVEIEQGLIVVRYSS